MAMAAPEKTLPGASEEAPQPINRSADYNVTVVNKSDYITAVLRRTDYHCMTSHGMGPDQLTIPPGESRSFSLTDKDTLFSSCHNATKSVYWSLDYNGGNSIDNIEFNHYFITLHAWRTEITTKNGTVKAWCDGRSCSDNGGILQTGNSTIEMDALYSSAFQLSPITITSPANGAKLLDTSRVTIGGTAVAGQTVVSGINRADSGTVTVDPRGNWQNPNGFLQSPGTYSADAAYVVNGRKVRPASNTFYVDKAVVIDFPLGDETLAPGQMLGVEGRAAVAGTLTYTLSGTPLSGPIAVKPNGTWGYRNTDATLHQYAGTHTFTVTQTLPGYPTSSASVNITLPRIKPVKITNPVDQSVHDADYTFAPQGVGEPGAQVTYQVPGISGGRGTAPVGSDGRWQGSAITLSSPNSYTMTAVQDEDGSQDTSRFSVDAAIKISAPDDNAWLSPGALALKGTGQPGESVNCYDGPMRVGGSSVGGDGRWQCNLSLGSGKHVLRASSSGGSNAYRTCFVASPLTLTRPRAGAWLTSPVTAEGTRDAQTPVSYVLNNQAPALAPSSDTRWNTPPLSLSPGRYTLVVYPTLEGEKGPAITRTFYVAHAPAVTEPANHQSVLTQTRYAINGTGEPGATVDVSLLHGWYPIGTVQVGDDGTWSTRGPASGTGDYILTVAQHKNGFNLGTTDTTVTVVDPPTAPQKAAVTHSPAAISRNH